MLHMRPRHPARTGLQGADSAPPVTAADSTSVTRNPQHPDPVSVHYSLHNDHAQNRNFWIQAQALPEVSAGRGIGLFNSQLSVTLRHRRTGKGRVRTGKARPVVERALIPRLYWTRPRVSAGQTGAPPGTRTPNPRIKSLSGASSTEFISVRAAG